MNELVPGGNLPLPGGALTLRIPGPFDVSALITDESGKVGGDADFVFYNQPTAPGARLQGDTLTVDPARLRTGAARVTVVISPADPGTSLGRLPAPTLQLTDTALAAPSPASPHHAPSRRPSCSWPSCTDAAPAGNCARWGRATPTDSRASHGTSAWMS